ncbi:hypothetical protein VPH35_139413 [Triticum aestivum]
MGATGGATPGTTGVALTGGRRRVGGRFWALADEGAEDSDVDDDGDLLVGPSGVPSPTPSDEICEAFRIGYPEDEVALLVDLAIPSDDPARMGLRAEDKVEIVTRIVHRRTATTAIRPWKGPLPKVIFRATAVIRSWSLLTPMEAREHLVTGSIRWEMVARDIFNRYGWRSCNRIGN